MKIIKFKTNIENQDGVTRVAPFLEKIENLTYWQIDPETEDNMLSVSGKNLNPQAIENAIQAAGFQAEVLRVIGLGGEDL